MGEKSLQVYGTRWIVLLLFMYVNIMVQILWISFAAVTLQAAVFYNVAEFDILLLSMIFMVIYIPVTFIASWLIDKHGFKIGTGTGALLIGIFGFLRFFAGNDYTLVLIFQIGIGIGQPFIMNSVTKLSANWFPEDERTSATGLSMLSQFVGIALGMVLTPFIVLGISFEAMIFIYGLSALTAGVLFLIIAKDKPPTPPSSEISSEKVQMIEGMKNLFKNKYFMILLIIFFIGLGVFNMITTFIELIVAPRGFSSTDAGILGGMMLIGGILGCVVMSALSDKYKKKIILMKVCVLIATVSLFVITFSSDIILLNVFGFLLGFGLLSSAPIALEYAVDITKPVPEATSNGLLMMIGQVGGIIFIIGFEGIKTPTGDYFPALLIEAILFVFLLVSTFFLKEK